MKLSVIITVYSETISLIETINILKNIDRGYIHEIILSVSPRSSTECMNICHSFAAENENIHVHIQKNNPGVGWAIREGMELAAGDYVALLSADLETEPEAVDRMVRKIEDSGCDGVIGNRWLPGGGFKNYDKIKLILNFLFQKIFQLLFRTKLGDLTYGYKILSSEICKKIHWEGTLHEIFIETTIKPIKNGYYIEQVPTVWIGRKEGISSNTFLKNFRYVWMSLRVLVKTN